jgi:hypothetical protein
MDETQHFSGESTTTRYRSRIHLTCPTHEEGHKMRCYSKGTDDAWWLADLFAAFVARSGFLCTVRFERSIDGNVWETVPPHDAVPEEPAF